ncbi:MAG: hypothetical protein ACE5SW_10150 [Nitrososphaeraceae archaeon]
MNYDYELGPTSNDNGMSMRQIKIIFVIAVVGIFLLFAIFIFPIQNLIRESVIEQVTVVSKSDGECVVDSKDHPRSIESCNYEVGDKLEITYDQGTVPVILHKKILN